MRNPFRKKGRVNDMDVFVCAIWLYPSFGRGDIETFDLRLFDCANTEQEKARNEMLLHLLAVLKSSALHKHVLNPTPRHVLVSELIEDSLFVVKTVYNDQSILWCQMWRESFSPDQLTKYEDCLYIPNNGVPDWHPTLYHGDFLLVRDVEYTSENFYSIFELYLKGEIQ